MATPSFLQRRPWALFLAVLLGGIVALLLALYFEPALNNTAWGFLVQFGEHLASALVIGAIMGLTYEWFVHTRSIKLFQELNESQNAVFHGLIETQNNFIARSLINVVADIEKIRKSVRAARADDVFKRLIHDMAEQRQNIPTLYDPPRDMQGEFVFSTNHEFFQDLVANKTDRSRVVEVLRDWLEPGKSAKFRFLASDFVGLLRLKELEPELRKRFEAKKPNWLSLSDQQEKSCLLNYAWAASRCEKPPYGYLSHLLRTMPADAQEWILFVPCQMQDPELRTMINEYLETKGPALSEKLLECVIAAVGSLHSADIDMGPVAKKHRPLFQAKKLETKLDEAVGIANGS